VAVGVHWTLDINANQLHRQDILDTLLGFYAANQQVYLYDPYTELCPEDMCLICDAETDQLLYRDDDHISEEASVGLAPHFNQWFKENFQIKLGDSG
jgi:hypothetical protein